MRDITDERALAALDSLIKEAEARIAELEKLDKPGT
jgi:hypothetical protein